MNCDIIRDLMPGYIDGVISETGNNAVKEHLEGCKECRRIFIEMKEDVTEENTPKERAVLDGFKRIRSRTRYLKLAVAFGGILLVLCIICVFCKVFVLGRLLGAHMVNTTGFQYDEETDSLTITGHMDINSGHVSRVMWKENPSIGDRVDLFVYAAENLPFGKKEREFSVTIPDMKGKFVYIVGSDYDSMKVYNWQDSHYELMNELEDAIRNQYDWEDRVLLIPWNGIRTVDGMEGIEYSVYFLVGDDAFYRRIGDTWSVYGEEDAGSVWISLETPHRIYKYDDITGAYEEADNEYELFRF